jgi:hypothetical protein
LIPVQEAQVLGKVLRLDAWRLLVHLAVPGKILTLSELEAELQKLNCTKTAGVDQSTW